MTKPFRSIVRPLAFVVLCCMLRLHASAEPTFSAEPDVRVTTAAPQAILGDASNMRLYFLRDFKIYSATSTDGFTFGEEAGVRLSSSTGPLLTISSITAFSLLPLDAGGYRAVYSAYDSTGALHVYSATSTDGLGWANDAGTRLSPSTSSTVLGSPRLIELSNGDWRLYYVQGTSTGAASSQGVFTSLSTDEGLTWSIGTLVLSKKTSEIAVSTLTNARVRLFYTASLSTETAVTQIVSALSSDANGTAFTDESGIRFATAAAAGQLSSVVVARSSETYRWRAYYGFTQTNSTITHTLSAITLFPFVKSFSPTSVNRSDPAATFTITGEVFSADPIVTLSKSGQSDIVGTSVYRPSDQTITAVFDTNQKDLGLWSVTVENSDGRSDTLDSAVRITFPGGTVTLLDNLMRPLTGARTQITATVFDDGDVRARIFSLDGRLLRTLIDGHQSAGVITFYWDGKTDDGNTVASGAYLLHVKGPKLDYTGKIVVIK